VQREQTDALARLEERLRREQYGAYTGLTGETLAAREYQQSLGLGAYSDYINTLIGQQGFRAGLTGEELSALAEFRLGEVDYVDRAFLNQGAAALLPGELDVSLTGLGLELAQGLQQPYPTPPEPMPR
jgi:hypothetical protein